MRTIPLLRTIGLVFTIATSANLGAVHAATVSEQLSNLGHPKTRPCQVRNSSVGLGDIPVLQFENKETSDDDEQEAIALLKLLAPALASSGQRYAGFDPRKDWTTCANQNPEYVFWRDYDDNWRFVKGTPSQYLARVLRDLPPEQRGTPVEAYVLHALGLVEQRLGHIARGIDRFERANTILGTTVDSKGIKGLVLARLTQHFLAEGNDEVKGEAYLQEYALVAESSNAEQLTHVPLVKVAPVYPSSAQRTGQEGYVILEFTVDVDGRIRNPIVIEESPEGVFADAAIDAAKKFRYLPKVVDGKFVPVAGVRNRISFELED